MTTETIEQLIIDELEKQSRSQYDLYKHLKDYAPHITPSWPTFRDKLVKLHQDNQIAYLDIRTLQEKSTLSRHIILVHPILWQNEIVGRLKARQKTLENALILEGLRLAARTNWYESLMAKATLRVIEDPEEFEEAEKNAKNIDEAEALLDQVEKEDYWKQFTVEFTEEGGIYIRPKTDKEKAS